MGTMGTAASGIASPGTAASGTPMMKATASGTATMELAVAGGSEFTLGFMLAGIRNLFTIETAETGAETGSGGRAGSDSHGSTNMHAEKMLDDIFGNKGIGVVIIDDRLLGALDERLREKVERSVRPVFVPLSPEASQETLRKMIIKSIGVDLMRE